MTELSITGNYFHNLLLTVTQKWFALVTD